jgi:transcriptional regulator with XRE-family HTH domain
MVASQQVYFPLYFPFGFPLRISPGEQVMEEQMDQSDKSYGASERERESAELSEKIKFLLDKCHLTYQAIATELEVDRKTISNWIHGKYPPRENHLWGLIELLARRGTLSSLGEAEQLWELAFGASWGRTYSTTEFDRNRFARILAEISHGNLNLSSAAQPNKTLWPPELIRDICNAVARERFGNYLSATRLKNPSTLSDNQLEPLPRVF